MAPTRPNKKAKKRTEKKPANPALLLVEAATKLQEGDLENAVSAAKKALDGTGVGGDYELAAVNLLGLIAIEMGEVDEARAYFLRAVELDIDGTLDERIGGGPEKFLWLAQLSEEGGQDSVNWFDKGAQSLRGQIQLLADLPKRSAEQETQLEERKRKLGGALCAVAEVYMTDLSWEADAEQRCEALITEAGLVAPESAETWQTVANVRISQEKVEEARAALARSLELWVNLPPLDPNVPDFPTRISLVRLLLEVEMEKEAIEVLERLVGDDDQSVEAWYLGGWALFIIGEKVKGKSESQLDEDDEDWKSTWDTSRRWLMRCQKLYREQEYEDERLGEHAKELLASINKELGDPPAEDEDDGWEDAGSDEDEAMEG
ncbi:TPR domain-containing protein [Colletotrichum graminicola]|uniref:TPR domain-containing protein n=1 Tax=Colletotrichum graminicola (strain M1.001 / M2 / FGSC 10212) TaxID=645133 RepID=E3QCW9_COLGM|nr:TPR domain-containing protein [Colletotrichum graminicola M1.001]EFQ28741.1 TPR domain-containing protein [Colletotrichum graminicola M1.001]WDK18864.1 TPR domain-containing protein [Colletotrichum graminicola]